MPPLRNSLPPPPPTRRFRRHNIHATPLPPPLASRPYATQAFILHHAPYRITPIRAIIARPQRIREHSPSPHRSAAANAHSAASIAAAIAPLILRMHAAAIRSASAASARNAFAASSCRRRSCFRGSASRSRTRRSHRALAHARNAVRRCSPTAACRTDRNRPSPSPATHTPSQRRCPIFSRTPFAIVPHADRYRSPLRPSHTFSTILLFARRAAARFAAHCRRRHSTP